MSEQRINGWPQNIWAVTSTGVAVNAQLENSESGASRATRSPKGDPFAAVVLDVTSGHWMGDTALDEVMAAARLTRIESTIEQLKASSVAATLELNITGLQPAAVASRGERPGAAPWDRGRRLATLAREHLGIRLDPLSSTDPNDLLRIDTTLASMPTAADVILPDRGPSKRRQSRESDIRRDHGGGESLRGVGVDGHHRTGQPRRHPPCVLGANAAAVTGPIFR